MGTNNNRVAEKRINEAEHKGSCFCISFSLSLILNKVMGWTDNGGWKKKKQVKTTSSLPISAIKLFWKFFWSNCSQKNKKTLKFTERHQEWNGLTINPIILYIRLITATRAKISTVTAPRNLYVMQIRKKLIDIQNFFQSCNNVGCLKSAIKFAIDVLILKRKEKN